MRVRCGLVGLLIGATALLSGCSSSESSERATVTTTTGGDAFCDKFSSLAEQREQQGGGGVRPGSTESVPDGKAGWDRRIATTAALAAAAPPDYQDEGAVYVELVTARAALFAAHDYPASLDEIPSDAVQAFIR